jgi:3-oxoacyl-[acyl-carrier protein] reductase
MTGTAPLSRSVAGRVAIVTGAASGMGRATALLLAAEGAKVAITDLDLAACEAVAAEAGPNSMAFALDVGDGDAIKRVVADIAASFGGIDIVINNAGVSSFAPLDADDEYEAIWHRAIAVMLTAHQRMVRAALPWLRQSDAARIVNIASTEGLGATPGDTPYVAAKSGVVGLTRGLAVDLGKDGITVNCICPGPIRTGMTDKVPDEDKAVFARRRTALRRYGEPEEVAHITQPRSSRGKLYHRRDNSRRRRTDGTQRLTQNSFSSSRA